MNYTPTQGPEGSDTVFVVFTAKTGYYRLHICGGSCTPCLWWIQWLTSIHHLPPHTQQPPKSESSRRGPTGRHPAGREEGRCAKPCTHEANACYLPKISANEVSAQRSSFLSAGSHRAAGSLLTSCQAWSQQKQKKHEPLLNRTSGSFPGLGTSFLRQI